MGKVFFGGMVAFQTTVTRCSLPVVVGWPCRLKQGSKHALNVSFSIDDVYFIVLAH